MLCRGGDHWNLVEAQDREEAGDHLWYEGLKQETITFVTCSQDATHHQPTAPENMHLMTLTWLVDPKKLYMTN